jgi:hypothetical protein
LVNNGFSEPCAGIFKFLDVFYECGFYSPFGSNNPINNPFNNNNNPFNNNPFNNLPNNIQSIIKK